MSETTRAAAGSHDQNLDRDSDTGGLGLGLGVGMTLWHVVSIMMSIAWTESSKLECLGLGLC